jgi:predicted dehydrogenase
MTKDKTKPIRIVIAGAGLIGQEHIKHVLAVPDAELAGIVDTDPKAQEQAASLHVPCTPDLETMLEKYKPDGVVVSLPNQAHFSVGMMLVKHGVPTLMEKPVCATLEEAYQLAEASEKAGVPILVGHHHRHNAVVKRAKEIIESGRLGKITAVNGLTWFRKPKEYFEGQFSWRRERGGGVVMVNLIHVMDDLRNLCGDVASVQAAGSNTARGFVVEDTVGTILRFQNGAIGTLAISDAVASPWSWEMTSGELQWFPRTDQSCYLVGGTEASLSLPRLELWHHGTGGHWFSPIQTERSVMPDRDPRTLELKSNPHLTQMRHFCDVIRGAAKPLLDARGGARTLEATLAVLKAAETGEIVHLS